MESKKIVKLESRQNGHLLLEFADNTMQMIVRGEHEEHELQVGDYWPPTKTVEESHALDTQASEEVALEGQSLVIPATGTDESGASRESQDGPREEGQLGTEAPTP